MPRKKKTKKKPIHRRAISALTLERRWRHWKYENTALLLLSLLVLFYVAQTPLIDSLINTAGDYSYIGAFVAGMFFVSTFTVAPAVIVLFHLADILNPIEVALLAGLGAMVGDYIIFRFMKDKVFEELRPLFLRLHQPKLEILFKSPYFAWMLPVFGAFIIASPLPDEVGVSVMGLSKIKRWQFFALAFVLNATGILLTISVAQAI